MSRKAPGAEKPKAGRPSLFTPVLAERVCELIAEGNSLHSIEQQDGMPSLATIMRWLNKQGAEFDAFRANYARAREARADARFERIDKVVDDMRTGVIDPQQARVEIDAIKWQAGKENSRRYGDAVTLKGDKDNPLQIAKPVDLSDADLLALAAGDKALDG